MMDRKAKDTKSKVMDLEKRCVEMEMERMMERKKSHEISRIAQKEKIPQLYSFPLRQTLQRSKLPTGTDK